MMKKAPEILPANINDTIRELAREWKLSPDCPIIGDDVLRHWDELIEDWIDDLSLPLIVRTSKQPTGSVVVHSAGRQIIPSDNSPACWAFTTAERKELLGLNAVKSLLDADLIPFSFAVKKEDRPVTKYLYNLSRLKDNPNARGYKLAHIDPVGMNRRGELESYAVNDLEDHFRRLLNPRNMFVVPKQLAGLAEVAVFSEVFRRAK